MNFSIITPSFQQSAWLKLCVASVADQSGVTLEHIVQDSCSGDDTKNWLPHDRRVRAFIEKDSGMYDAVNRGFHRAQGDVLAYLNCDEQYLPGALRVVHDFFAANPEVEAVFADSMVTDSDGNYICHRPALIPSKSAIWVRLPVLTSGIFIRRSVIHERGLEFDTQWRDLGDFWWIREFLLRGVRIKVLPELTSVFSDTGDNMNLKPNARREDREKWSRAPGWVKLFKLFLIAQTRARFILRAGSYREPFDYSIFTLASPAQRVVLRAARPTTFWKGRLILRPVPGAS